MGDFNYLRMSLKNRYRMKKTCFLLIFLVCCLCLSAQTRPKELSALFARLDSLIEQKPSFAQSKQEKIAHLRRQQKGVQTTEEAYWTNKAFYDEFYVYDADSAMTYVERNLQIARQQHNRERTYEWKIKRSFLLAATGLLTEALNELRGIWGSMLPRELQTEYYGQMLYIYSHFGQYSGDNNTGLQQKYSDRERAYEDSLKAIIQPQDLFYYWYQGQAVQGTGEMKDFIGVLKEEVENAALDSRRDAMNAYILACLCRDSGLTDDYVRYLIYSAIADVRIDNKDIASLEELGKTLYREGEIDRAYTYLNYCFQNAISYRNRIRLMSISTVLEEINRIYRERNARQEARLRVSLIWMMVLATVLLAAVCYIYKQIKRLKRQHCELNEANRLQNEHISELKEARQEISKVNEQLKSLNGQLTHANSQLLESNYVKEEYIGYAFALCSNYISKLDEFRKNINRKAKTKQFDEIRALTDSPGMAQNELKEFYHNFDAIFLHVYPDFVSDFNALLHPDAQIIPKSGELLNTELRIYALVRLGISDSVKIAEFLHCSPQTVYNNRLKTRNKAIIPKEDFADTVKSLGKMQKE